MKKVRSEMSDGAKESNGFLLVEVVVVEVSVEMKKVLKKRKMAVEGIDCHMRNPKKRFLTTISSGVAKDIIDMVVLVFGFWSFFILTKVCLFDDAFGFCFCWRSLGEEDCRVDTVHKDSGGVLNLDGFDLFCTKFLSFLLNC